jgi:hypothetical protein
MLVFSVCNWLDAGPKNSKGGFKPSTVIHTYRDSEPFFAVMATMLDSRFFAVMNCLPKYFRHLQLMHMNLTLSIYSQSVLSSCGRVDQRQNRSA